MTDRAGLHPVLTTNTDKSAAEITSGIIASCLPALPTFLRHFFQKTRYFFSEPVMTSSGSTYIASKKTVEAKRFPAQHRRNVSLTDLLPGDNLEMLSRGNRSGKTYETTCYTTVEASPVEKGRDDHSKVGDSPNRGILKTVEVDVESGPEQTGRKK
ncbi:unnamed protein product [Aspergillus oryzae]|nr:unnamed protein product [Aspergillus oryzae]GMF84339.1 unnamed protein product [Aspergillus oryzae]